MARYTQQVFWIGSRSEFKKINIKLVYLKLVKALFWVNSNLKKMCSYIDMNNGAINKYSRNSAYRGRRLQLASQGISMAVVLENHRAV